MQDLLRPSLAIPGVQLGSLLRRRNTRTHWRRRLRPTLPPKQRNMFPFRNVPTVRIPQQPFNLLALMSLDPVHINRGVIHNGAAHILGLAMPQLPIFCRAAVTEILLDDEQPDAFVAGKGTLHVDHADGEETCLVEEGFVAARVDVYVAVGLETVENPEGAVPDGMWRGEEARV